MAKRRDWLIDIRKRLGLSVPEIAEKVGVAEPTWYNYENGHRTPRGYKALHIANTLGFPVDYFFLR